MASFIKVEVLGYLGKAPEVKFNAEGKAIAHFSVGTNEKVKENGNTVDKTQWANITAFSKTAENCGQYLNKGDQVLVHGRLQVREYTHNNEKRFSIDVLADSVTFLGKKDAKNAPDDSAPF
jgi:single-strand DNA-binding protein